MVSVASLLNPLPPSFEGYRQLPSPCSNRYSPDCSPPLPSLKRPKMAKDAAIFAKGKTKGEIRYGPHEIQSEEVAEQQKKFHVYPMGHIAEYCRHIPYNSEKKSFLEKTGRESFEVFQYTFKVPGDEREYAVMWDYNVGLVRMTPFFKCCKYPKTTPAKMLGLNPGLRDICHSITGGALVAQGNLAGEYYENFSLPFQGYWLPFEAAKAVAATFCYNIRYALTPIFGLDFASLCIVPDDPSFDRMIIDRRIIQRCTEEAKGFRIVSREASLAGSPRTPTPSNGLSWTPKALASKPIKATDHESGYGSDPDRDDRYTCSPHSSKSGWTAMNTPRSANSQQYPFLFPREVPSAATKISEVPLDVADTSSGEEATVKRANPEDDDYDGDSISTHSSEGMRAPVKRRKKSAAMTKEAKAAYMLMQLNMADATIVDDGLGGKRRRASS